MCLGQNLGSSALKVTFLRCYWFEEAYRHLRNLDHHGNALRIRRSLQSLGSPSLKVTFLRCYWFEEAFRNLRNLDHHGNTRRIRRTLPENHPDNNHSGIPGTCWYVCGLKEKGLNVSLVKFS